MNESQYYWHIELYSGEIIKVKPDTEKIEYIQGMISKQQGAITTPTRSVVIKDVKDFRMSDEVYSDQKLLESAAQAFKEPLFTDDGAMQCRLVKKSVPRRKWESYYSKIPSYRLLSENDSFVVMAFTVAAHEVDYRKVQDLTQDEERRLSVKITV